MKIQSLLISRADLLTSAIATATILNLSAATLTWDPSSGGTTDGAGAWLDAGKWWDGGANVDWTSGDDAIFGNGGTGGAVTLASPATANSITFNAFTGTYDIGSSGQTLTITNGITHNVGAGFVEMESPVDNGGTDLHVNVLEATPADRSFANVELRQDISGAGGLIKSGPGSVWIQYTGTLSYTGNTVVNGGILRSQVSGGYLNGLPGNLELNGGVAEAYWGETFTRSLGTASGQVQLPGGESGFSQHGGTGLTVRLNNDANTPIVWGSATFNPSALVLQSINSNNGSSVLLDNNIDLNGAQREIRVNQGNYTGVKAEIDGILSNSDAVNPAGFTKTGDGLLILDVPNDGTGNTFEGPVIINGGIVQFGTGFSTTWNNESLPTTQNLEINGGNAAGWFSFNRDLGTGPGEVQITGGTSGFTMKQGDRVDFTLDGGAEVTWGDPAFNPSVFVLNLAEAGPSSPARLNNPLDLNGADRTIFTSGTGAAPVNGATNGAFGPVVGRGAVINGDIRTSSGTAGLFKTGVGILALDGTNTYNGGTSINEGGVYFPKIVSMPADGVVSVANGATLLVPIGGSGEWTTGTSGNGTLGGLLAGLGGQAPSTVSLSSAANLGLVISGTQTYSGVVSSGGNVATFGDGTLVLDQNNTFTGNLIIEAGSSLQLAGDNSGASGNVDINNGYLLADLANLPGGRVNFNSGGTDPAIWVTSGELTPTIGTGDDIYWNASGGFAASDSALTVTVNGGSTIDWSAGGGFRGQKLMLGSPVSTASVELTNDIDLDGDRTIRMFDNSASNDDIAILSGNIDGGGTARRLTVEGSGTLVLSGTNDFGTKELYIGSSGPSSVVRATDGVGLPTAAKLYFNNGVLETSGSFTRDIGTGSGEVYWNNKGGFAANGGALTVNLEGGAALNFGSSTVGFRGQNPLYLGSDTADDVVTIQNGIILDNNRNINVPDNPDTDTDYAVISGVISQSGTRNLQKDGNGKLVLTAANTYTGTTTVNGGTLIIDGSTSTGLVDVKSNGKFLGGTGTIGGSVTLENNAGLTFDLVTAPGSHDKLDVAGSLTFESASVLTLTSSGGTPSTGTFTLVSAAGGISGSVPATVNLPVDWTADAPQIVGNDLVINITSVGAVSSPYDDWAAAYPGFTDTLPTQNPDGDNLPNLLEFGFGTNPTVSDAGSLTWDGTTVTPGTPVVLHSFPGGGGVDFKARFIRRTDHGDLGSVNYAWRFSSDLADWESSADTPSWLTVPTQLDTFTGADGVTYELLEIPYPLWLDNNKKARFFQVEVTEVP